MTTIILAFIKENWYISLSVIVTIGLYVSARTKNKTDDNIFNFLKSLLSVVSVFKQKPSKLETATQPMETVINEINDRFKVDNDEGKEAKVYRSDVIGGDK